MSGGAVAGLVAGWTLLLFAIFGLWTAWRGARRGLAKIRSSARSTSTATAGASADVGGITVQVDGRTMLVDASTAAALLGAARGVDSDLSAAGPASIGRGSHHDDGEHYLNGGGADEFYNLLDRAGIDHDERVHDDVRANLNRGLRRGSDALPAAGDASGELTWLDPAAVRSGVDDRPGPVGPERS